MTPQEKLAAGMTLFVILFIVAFLFVPANVYHDYFSDVKRRKGGRLIQALGALVFLLAVPYFYDELVGLDDPRVSLALQVIMGATVYMVVIDVAIFVYRQFGRPSQRPPRTLK